MPIRCLEYIARLYEQFYKSKEKYSRKQLAIPTPEFFIFYNGKQPYNTASVLKLSDSFTQKHDEYALELSVKVININYGLSIQNIATATGLSHEDVAAIN